MTEMNQQEGREALFDILSDVRAGMLGVVGSGQHLQPMSQHTDSETGEIWFITSRTSDLVGAVGSGHTGQFSVTGKDHRAWACMSGPLEQVDDTAKLDEIWNAVAAAWFDKGRDDPDICLLRLTLASASLWTATGNPLVFGLEIARANMSEQKKPDVGSHVVIEFGRAA